jgi:hypothetical protein
MPPPTVLALTRREDTPDRFYFRVGNNDHVALEQLLAARRLHADGFVLDARRHTRHESLRQQANEADIATCLDTQAMELVMPGTSSKGHAELPWAQVARGTPEAFSYSQIEQFVQGIVACSVEGHYSHVMAPTHYLPDLGSGWADVDDRLVRELREQLDDVAGHRAEVIYPLAVHGRLIYESSSRALLMKGLLHGSHIDTVALRIQPFAHDSGARVLRKMIEACTDLRQLEKPLMIERAGFLGLALYAFGAVQVLASSVVNGDSFDIGRLQRPAPAEPSKGFDPHHAVYIEALGSSVALDVAKRLLDSANGKLRFACRQPECCPNGAKDMLAYPLRHSALSRRRQYDALEKVPPTLRAEAFVRDMLTSVCDRLALAADVDDSFKKIHRRMLSMKEMLVDLQRGQAKVVKRPGPAYWPGQPNTTAQIIPLTPRDPRGR